MSKDMEGTLLIRQKKFNKKGLFFVNLLTLFRK